MPFAFEILAIEHDARVARVKYVYEESNFVFEHCADVLFVVNETDIRILCVEYDNFDNDALRDLFDSAPRSVAPAMKAQLQMLLAEPVGVFH